MKEKLLLLGVFLVLFLILLGVLTKFKQKPAPPSVTNPSNIILPESRLIKSITTILETTSDPGSSQVDWSQTNDLIAFNKSGEDGYADIYTMNPDGSNQKCITCDRSDVPQLNNANPAWHPSGGWIVLQSQDPNLRLPDSKEKYFTGGGAGLNNNLLVAKADGSRFYQLTKVKFAEGSLHARFSNDGTKLLWSARIVDEQQRGRWVLKLADFVINPDGFTLANEIILAPLDNPDAFYESHGFSKDDSKIIFSGNLHGGKTQVYTDFDIYTLDPKTGNFINLTNSPDAWDELATVSPSGKRIAWLSSTGYSTKNTIADQWLTLKTDLWIMNADGHSKQRLTYFNEQGYSEYIGDRVITGDSSWNKDGTKMVVKLESADPGIKRFQTLFEQKKTRIVVIEFREPQ